MIRICQVNLRSRMCRKISIWDCWLAEETTDLILGCRGMLSKMVASKLLRNKHSYTVLQQYASHKTANCHEKAERASAEIPESHEMIGQRIREAPTGQRTRSSRYSARRFRKRWSVKKVGIILVCTSRQKQLKETRKKEIKQQDKTKVQFWIIRFRITLGTVGI